MASAAIITIGNELVSGDVDNTNASWLAQRLEALGVAVPLVAAIPDDLEGIASFVREQRARVDVVLVTGGPRRGAPDAPPRAGGPPLVAGGGGGARGAAAPAPP